MALKTDKEMKLYYSIKEVAEMVGVSEPTLRFWEKEFPQIAPKKGENKVRKYTREDIGRIQAIYHLVKEKGLTLKGAREHLKKKKSGLDTTVGLAQRLKAVREELVAIRDSLDLL